MLKVAVCLRAAYDRVLPDPTNEDLMIGTPQDLIFVSLSTFAERDEKPLEQLKASGFPFRIHTSGKRITRPELRLHGSDAIVIIASVEPYDAGMLEELPALRCIARCGTGVDAVDLDAARRRGITVVNTPDSPTTAVAELALAMFLALSRNLRPQATSMAARHWERLEAHLLSGRTIGLIGLGRIGMRVAKLCRAFGARVIASDPQAKEPAARSVGVEIVQLRELLQQADIVSLHAAKIAETPLVLGAMELSSMKRGAIVVNLARGGMVDEAALIDALRRGHIAGAGLDVFSDEPYTGALCDFQNVILTPHAATLTVETRSAMELEAVDKALRFLRGTLLLEEKVV
jgi:D-3-phosphoglycerate dehydrogenase / 2-oxoglutarate reductase